MRRALDGEVLSLDPTALPQFSKQRLPIFPTSFSHPRDRIRIGEQRNSTLRRLLCGAAGKRAAPRHSDRATFGRLRRPKVARSGTEPG